MIHDTQSAPISQKQDEYDIYFIMKTMCLPGYHHNGFVATHVPKCMSCHKAIVVITGRAHCFHDNIYIYENNDYFKDILKELMKQYLILC